MLHTVRNHYFKKVGVMGWYRNKMTRIKYKLFIEGFTWKYKHTEETWRMLRVLGAGQETYTTNSAFDCSGQPFCWGVDRYLFGLVTIGYYGIDV
jgi:hypothetical protein